MLTSARARAPPFLSRDGAPGLFGIPGNVMFFPEALYDHLERCNERD